jgi:hypothetical protein
LCLALKTQISIEAGIAADLHYSFRAGQSMHYILFSTLPHHGLRGELHVTLGMNDDEVTKFFVACSRENIWFSPSITRDEAGSPNKHLGFLRFI